MNLHPPTWNDVIDFLVLYVVVRGILARWMARYITKLMKIAFIRSEQEILLYLAYRARAVKKAESARSQNTSL